jgi:hypothetical protein
MLSASLASYGLHEKASREKNFWSGQQWVFMWLVEMTTIAVMPLSSSNLPVHQRGTALHQVWCLWRDEMFPR